MSTRSEVRESAPKPLSRRAFDVRRLREDFPILRETIHGKPLVYLDNAATTQKPRVVLDAMDRCFTTEYANVHRGVHTLSERATATYEQARSKVRAFIHAADDREIVFTRGTTEAINLVAQTFGRKRVGPGDEIVLTAMEHHSNIVPWQLLCEEKGAKLRVIPMSDAGELVLDGLDDFFGPRTRLAAIVHVSNALGTINPIAEIIERAHRRGVPVLIDGAQAVAHREVDVASLGCDFYAFSGHKIFGPTGIGVLYGKRDILEAMPPWQGGGDMISSVTFEKTTYNRLPWKFEAGTPNFVAAVGLGAALDYVSGIGLAPIGEHEHDVLAYATEKVASIPRVRLVGTAREKSSVLSFVIDGVHPHDVGTILDGEGIAIRAGNHCAQPVMDRLGLPATSRASFAFYNTRDEVDALVAGIRRVTEVFA